HVDTPECSYSICSTERRDLLPSRFFFFTATATAGFYTLSLHDALPIWLTIVFHGGPREARFRVPVAAAARQSPHGNSFVDRIATDRKSTRLNSSHRTISYAVFCLKKKKKTVQNTDGTTRPISRL